MKWPEGNEVKSWRRGGGGVCIVLFAGISEGVFEFSYSHEGGGGRREDV